MVALPIIFTPTPEATAAILADLDDCSLSFDALAKKHGTSADALALWLSTSPVKDQIQTTLDSMALRVRRLATSRLPAAAAAICRIVGRHDGAQDQPLDTASHTYLADLERRRRRDESTRRACALLLRLANFFSPHTRPRERAPTLTTTTTTTSQDSRDTHLLDAVREAVERQAIERQAAVRTSAAPVSVTSPAPARAPLPTRDARTTTAAPTTPAPATHTPRSTPAPTPAPTLIPTTDFFTTTPNAPFDNTSSPLLTRPAKRPTPAALLARAGACTAAAP